MKRMKRCLCVLLSLLIFVSSAGVFAAEEKDWLDRHFYEESLLGGAVRSVDSLVVEFGVEDGKQMMYTTMSSRPTSTFVVYNMDDKRVERSFPLQNGKYYTKTSWYLRKGPDGNIYIVPHGYLYLYRYNVETKQIECSSGDTPLDDVNAGYGLTFDEAGNIYFGAYPKPNLYQFDKDLNLVREYSNIFPNQRYVMSALYYKGRVYMGGQDPSAMFASVDVKTGEVRKEQQPSEVFGSDMKITSYYMSDQIDNLLFFTTKVEGQTNSLIIFDADKGEWVHRNKRAYGFFLPPYKGDGKTYFLGGELGAPASEIGIIQLDIKTFEEKNMKTPYYENLVGSAWIKFPDHPELPGESLVTFSRSEQALVAFNFEAQKTVVLKEYQLPSVGSQIQRLEAGLNNTLLMGSYMGEYMVVYDPDTGKTVKYKGAQSECIKRYGTTAYLGGYTQAVLYEYDLTKEPSESNPKLLGSLGSHNQDRIFDVCKIDDNLIAVGSYPRAGYTTGGIGVYDKRTQKFDFYPDLFPGQSIDGLAYKDGVLYGCTSTYVPVTPYPADEAYVFAFDLGERKVTKQATVKIDGAPAKNKTIGDLEIGPDGNLWGVTSGAVFCMDPETLETKKSAIPDRMFYNRRVMATVSQIHFDQNGMLYTSLNGYFTMLNPETMKFKNTMRPMQYFTFGGDGNLYHTGWSADGYNLYKLRISDMGEKEYGQIEKAVGDGLVMQMNSNMAYANRQAVFVDPDDPAVTAKEKDGRVLVPIRFIAQSTGAKVDWEEDTNTAVVVNDGNRIKVTIGDDKLLINNKPVSLDVPAYVENGRTFLPLRAICEALGKSVYWNESGMIIISEEENQVDEKNTELLNSIQAFIEKDVPAILSGNYKIPEV